MSGKRRDANTIAVTERRAKVLAFRRAGASHRAIAVELGVDHSTIVRDVHAIFRQLAEEQHASAEEYRAMELERLDTLSLEASRILQAVHPLISGGKVLTRFTNDGKAVGLTDDGPKLQAIDRLLRISESRRKLLGLDAPAQVQIGGSLQSPLYLELRAVVLGMLPVEQRLLLADELDKVIDASTVDRPSDES
jgi:hypothetical protein